MPGALVNLNLARSYQDYYYPNNSGQNDLYNYLFRNNSSIVSRYHDSLSYKQLEQLHSRTITILDAITNIQEKMIEQSEEEFGKPSVKGTQIWQSEAGNEIVYTGISNPMDPGPALNFLLPGCTARKELNTSMEDYVSYLSGLVPPQGLTNYKKMLETDTLLPVIIPKGGYISLVTGLHALQIMKNRILTVESYALNTIARNN
jgi:hypothetical protein